MARNRRPPKRDLFGAIAHLGAEVEHVAHTAGRKADLDKHVQSHVRHHRTGGKQLITPMKIPLSPVEERYVQIETKKRLNKIKGPMGPRGPLRTPRGPRGPRGPMMPPPSHGGGGILGAIGSGLRGAEHFVEGIPGGLQATVNAAGLSDQQISGYVHHPLRTNQGSKQWGTLLTHPGRYFGEAESGVYGPEVQNSALFASGVGKSVQQAVTDPSADWVNTASWLFPFGQVGKIGRLAKIGKAGEEIGRTGEEAALAGSAGRLAARRAKRLARRAAPMTPEEAHAHVLDLAERAAEEPLVQSKMGHPKFPVLEPGQVTPETGGLAGQKIRAKMTPDLARLYEGQKELQSAELGKKAGKLRAARKEALNAPDPWKASLSARGVLKGKLSTKEWSGFDDLTREDQLSILQHVDSLNLREFERDNLIHAIENGVEGVIPPPYERTLIARAFGIEKTQVAAAIKAGGLKKAIVDFINIPRAIKSAGDLSWGFRQALATLTYNPKIWASEFGKMFKVAASEGEAQARMAAIRDDPLYPLAIKDGLPLTDIGAYESGVAKLNTREEAIMSNWAEHLHELPGVRATPGVKQAAHGVSAIVRASDRGYVVPLNGSRMALYDRWVHQAAENGWALTGSQGEKLRKDLANVAGALTGRGHLPSSLAKHRAAINAIFWSPGLMASRINMLNPYWYYKLEPFARQQALKSIRNLMGTLAFTLFALEQAGAHVEWDPRNSDFGKPRIGNTRLDIGGGFSQYMTLAARLGTQETISSTSGKHTPLTGDPYGISNWEVLQNFFTNKAAPPLAEGIAVAKQGRFGQPLTATGELSNIFAPLAMHDIYQLAKSEGPGGGPGMAAALALPDLFGIGVQNYTAPAANSPEKIKAATTEAFTELRKQMNTLKIPPKDRASFLQSARVKVQRDLAKDQARKLSPDGKISDLESYKITMNTLVAAGMADPAKAKAAIRAVSTMTDRDIRHWEYEAWANLGPRGWGPGRWLEWVHSQYNIKTGK